MSEPPSAPPWRQHWLWFALPLLVVYAVYCAGVWPALLSSDSLDYWEQARAGVLDRSHSVLYSLICLVGERLTHSTSAIAIAQCLISALAIAWSLGHVVRLGGSRVAAWIVVALACVTPAHAILAVTIWPDTLFSTAVLVFSVLLFRFARGDLRAPLGLVSIVLLAAVVGLMRPNGPAAAFPALAVLVLLCSGARLQGAVLLTASVALYLFLNGPIYRAMGVQPSLIGSRGWMNPVVLQIAAHTAARTELSDEQRAFLRQAYPSEPWPYMCESGGVTGWHPDFHPQVFDEHPQQTLELWWDLTRRAPAVNLKHQKCLSAFAWHPFGVQDTYLFALTIKDERLHTQRLDNVEKTAMLPIETNSRAFEAIVRAMLKLAATAQLRALFWATAGYLYLFFGCVAYCAVRHRSLRLAIVLTPVLGNTLGIVLFSGTPEYRYLYSNVLVALAFLPFVFSKSTTAKV